MSSSGSGVLARGPWSADQITVRWHNAVYQADEPSIAEADRAIAALAERGSPSHDGLAARMRDWRRDGSRLALELEPMRWALRLGPYAAGAMTVLCVIRRADGAWLAGRRAPWVASWAGRWALGAGGSVEVGESPVQTLERELEEEWSVVPESLSSEALVSLPNGMAMLIGQAWLPQDAEVLPDAEHDEYAWWPADVVAWPGHADEALRRVARMLDPA